MQKVLPGNGKLNIVCGLLIIIVIVMLTIYYGKRSYADLDKNISSIYQDRLMPAAYLFHINDLLYKKKLLQDQRNTIAGTSQIKAHDDKIILLMQQYEDTYLTQNEQKQWASFTHHLEQYNVAAASPGNQATLDDSFREAVNCLNSLTDIQLAEGKALQYQARSILGGNLLQSYFELSLLFVVCILVLVLINVKDHGFYSGNRTALMN